MINQSDFPYLKKDEKVKNPNEPNKDKLPEELKFMQKNKMHDYLVLLISRGQFKF